MRNMIRTKILAVVFLSIILLTGILYFVSTNMLLESYRTIETSAMERNLVRVKESIQNHGKSLNVKLRDWAQWDDTYRFIEDHNEEYMISNLADETLVNLEIHYMAFLSRSGEVVFAKQIDLEEGSEVPNDAVTSEVLGHLRNQDDTLRLASSGLLKLDQDLFILEALPIIYSDGTGTPIGTLVFGRFIDGPLMQNIADLTQLSVEILPYEVIQSDPLLSDIRDTLSSQPYTINATDGATIYGYFPLLSNDREPLALVQVETGRDIFKQGQRTVSTFIVLSSGSILLFGAVILIILEVLMLRRFKRFVQQVDMIDTHSLTSAHIDGVRGKDEIGTLASKINHLLHELAQAQKKERALAQMQQQTNTELKENLEELEKINKLLVGRELKMVELKEEVERLRGQK